MSQHSRGMWNTSFNDGLLPNVPEGTWFLTTAERASSNQIDTSIQMFNQWGLQPYFGHSLFGVAPYRDDDGNLRTPSGATAQLADAPKVMRSTELAVHLTAAGLPTGSWTSCSTLDESAGSGEAPPVCRFSDTEPPPLVYVKPVLVSSWLKEGYVPAASYLGTISPMMAGGILIHPDQSSCTSCPCTSRCGDRVRAGD